MTARADLPEAVKRRLAIEVGKLRAAELGGCFRPENVPQGECVDGDCYCMRQCEREAEIVAAEFLAIIEERAGPDWSINYGPSRQPAQVGRVSLAELLEDRDAAQGGKS